MSRVPPRSNLTDPLFPDTTLFRSWSHQWGGDHGIYGTATDYMKIRWNALAHPGNRPDIRLSNMALYLVNPAVEMSLELYISQQLEEAITIQRSEEHT